MFLLVARDRLYALSYSQDSTYHGLWYTIHGAQVEMRRNPNQNDVPRLSIYLSWIIGWD